MCLWCKRQGRHQIYVLPDLGARIQTQESVWLDYQSSSQAKSLIAAVGSFILGNDRWSLVRSFDPSFASGNSQWKNLLYDALWPISSRVIRNWHVLAQQKIVLAQQKIACARSQLELSFLVDRSQDLRLFPGKLWHLITAIRGIVLQCVLQCHLSL